jgi:iron(III) transport system substrate-binding protein
MHRRTLLQGLLATGLLGPTTVLRALAEAAGVRSVDDLAKLSGPLTLYLGRGEGGFYEDVIEAIRARSPELALSVRRGGSAGLANTLAAEARAGVRRADLFWAIDSGALGFVAGEAGARPVPAELSAALHPDHRFANWVPISGRVRTLPYNPQRLDADAIPKSIMDLAESEFSVGWAPAYGAFQSFVTAMRLLEGEPATREWLRAMRPRATSYAGELGVVMGVERGEVDLGLANHYYSLRLKQGRPDASLELAFTRDDAGVLLNASGVVILGDGPTPKDFVAHLLTREVQSWLVREAFEIPMVPGVEPPPGLPPLGELRPPRVDLRELADLRPTLDLMRDVGVL